MTTSTSSGRPRPSRPFQFTRSVPVMSTRLVPGIGLSQRTMGMESKAEEWTLWMSRPGRMGGLLSSPLDQTCQPVSHQPASQVIRVPAFLYQGLSELRDPPEVHSYCQTGTPPTGAGLPLVLPWMSPLDQSLERRQVLGWGPPSASTVWAPTQSVAHATEARNRGLTERELGI